MNRIAKEVAAVLLFGGAAGCASHIGISWIPPGQPIYDRPEPARSIPAPVEALARTALGRTPEPAGLNPTAWLDAAEAYAGIASFSARPADGLCVAALCWRYLASGPPASQRRDDAIALYNHAVTGLMADWPRTRRGDLADGYMPEFGAAVPVRVDWPDSDFVSGYFDEWTPTSAFDVVGFRQRYTRSGLGVALVGFRQNGHVLPEEIYYPLGGISRPVTAVLVAEAGRPPRLVLLDSFRRRTVGHGLGSQRLAADITAAIARLPESDPVLKLSHYGFIGDERRERKPELGLLEPFDPGKIPVVLVHGLRSSPLIWRDLANEIVADPDLNDRFQLWFYFYPTNEPYLVDAADLRRRLRAARAFFTASRPAPALDDMVLVGHSMGGLICRALVTDTGEALWNAALRPSAKPADRKKPVPTREASELRGILVFRPEPYVRRVVFLATPHRGTQLADSWLGRLVSGRISLPDEFRATLKAVQDDDGFQLSPFLATLVPANQVNSVRVLSPQNPVLRALADLPIAPGVRYHTITGDRGRGDGPAASDGVVPYASSHLAGADSELVVASDHSLANTPAAVDEIIRILRLHLAEGPP